MNYDKDVRTRVNEALIKYNIKQIDLAKETNVHHSTLSLWLQGKVKGTQIKIEESMERWLHNIHNVSKNKAYSSKPLNRLQLLKGKREKPNFDKVQNNKGFGTLIPITINVELEGKKFKEIFFWDYYEPYLQPEQFVKILIEDNNLPTTFEQEILNQLTRQISQYAPTNDLFLEGEIIKTIKLDLRIEDKLIEDQFEWDINNPENKPEDFAEAYCRDLSLDTEFMLPIAHSIKEQLLEYRKNILVDKSYLYTLINSSKNIVEDKEGYNLSFVRDTISHETTDYQPSLKIISAFEIQKYEQKEERKSRYAQRKK